MSRIWRMTGSMVCMTAALVVGSTVQAQTQPTPVAKMPASLSAPAQPADEADAIFARWDTNHDGVLSRDEFRAGWQKLQVATELRQLHEQFVAMDTDKNGCLNATEYAHLALIQKAGKSAPPLSMFDTQKNQCLDFKEYVDLIDYMIKHEHK
jgi:Ca2+-binding EF-hand superfamily protein